MTLSLFAFFLLIPTGCADSSKTKVFTRDTDCYLKDAPFSVYPWRGDALRQAPNDVKVEHDTSGWVLTLPPRGNAALVSSWITGLSEETLQIRIRTRIHSGHSSIRHIVKIHEGDRIREVLNTLVSIQNLDTTITIHPELKRNEAVCLDLRLSSGPVTVYLDEFSILDREANPVFPSSLLLPSTDLMVNDQELKLVSRHASTLKTVPDISYSILDSEGNKVFQGTLKSAEDSVSVSLPIGWYRVISETNGDLCQTSFAVIPENNNGEQNDTNPLGLHVTATEAGANLASLLGAGWVRWHGADLLKWKAVEPNMGEWSFPDNTVSLFEQAGLSQLGVLGMPPDWASSDPAAPSIPHSSTYFGPAAQPPANRDEWQEYVRQTAQRYSGIINRWEVWNEPDIHFLVGGAEGKAIDYSNIWKAAEEVANRENLLGPVLAYFITEDKVRPGTGGFPKNDFYRYRDTNFFQKLKQTEVLDSLTTFSFHHYSSLNEPFSLLRKNLSVEVEKLHKDFPLLKEIWVTESNVLGSTESLSDELDIASRMVRDILAMLANGVDKVFTYAAFAPMHGELYGSRYSNFYRYGSPAPRLAAYSVLSSLVMGPGGPAQISEGVTTRGESYYLLRPDGRKIIAWYASDNDLTIQIPEAGWLWNATGILESVNRGESITVPAKRIRYLLPIKE